MKSKLKCLMLSLSVCAALFGCSGDNGSEGAAGIAGAAGLNGQDGTDGFNSLVQQLTLQSGNEQCFKGGTAIQSGLDVNENNILDSDEVNQTSYICKEAPINSAENFVRVASFPICEQQERDCNTDIETAAEIVTVNEAGTVLIYSNSPQNSIGFVDITDMHSPQAMGELSLDGEPTSVATNGNFVVVSVNTSEDFVNVSGILNVVNIETQEIVHTITLPGQPDSIATSPDGNYIAVVIENERDEDLGDGLPPQLPAGSLSIIDAQDAEPSRWSITDVNLTGIAELYPSDPEPEYVDINDNNIAVITFQENNHIALIDLSDGSIVNHFSAGAVDLVNIDIVEESPSVIDASSTLDQVLREPDGVTWINNTYFATANEGDVDGGSRGFSVFNVTGDPVWDSAESLDQMAIRFGHYPDQRSENRGNEPENVELGIFGEDRYLFVNSERSSLSFVYDIANPEHPVFKQVLPTALAPEGGLAIPSRNLFVVASEEDSRDDKVRSALNIYSYNIQESTYPIMESVNDQNDRAMPWGALSGLAADVFYDNILYSVSDNFYASNRIFTIDTSLKPARITSSLILVDSNDVLANLITQSTEENDELFDDVDLANLINDDKTVNIDSEGIARVDDGFWIASEGSGTIGDTEDRPILSLNMLLKISNEGSIEQLVTLPEDVNNMQLRFGFEGVAHYNNALYVVFQRAWGDEANPRIGIFDLVSETWSFVFYPLDSVESSAGGWVGLSDISSLGAGRFLVLERDNQGGPDAAIKRIYQIDLNDFTAEETLPKSLYQDIIPTLAASGGLIPEKVEGLAVTSSERVFVVNDNDGVDDNSGETQLITIGEYSQ